MSNRRVRASDLEDQTSTSGPRPFLYCTKCGERFSGLGPNVEFADSVTGFLVDEQDDAEHERSRRYKADGLTPDVISPGVPREFTPLFPCPERLRKRLIEGIRNHPSAYLYRDTGPVFNKALEVSEEKPTVEL